MRISDWSSDVCSSDLPQPFGRVRLQRRLYTPSSALAGGVGGGGKEGEGVEDVDDLGLQPRGKCGAVDPDGAVRPPDSRLAVPLPFGRQIGIADEPERTSVVKGKSVS